MITAEHIKIFERYKCNEEIFIRLGSKEDKEILTHDNWRVIEDLLQDIELIKNDLIATKFSTGLNIRLTTSCESEEAVRKLKAIVERRI